MNIIIPMAGLGKRFSDAGFNLPKPLIKVADRPMYQHAVNSLPLQLSTKLIFLIREDNYSNLFIKSIKACYSCLPDCYIIILTNPTHSQIETVLQAENFIDKNEPTLIHNCDTIIDPELNWDPVLENGIDGGIVLFTSQEKKWSYAKLNEEKNKIIDFQERKVISCHAATGTYYFKDSIQLMTDIKKIIINNSRKHGEFHISTVYKLMINEKKNIYPLWTNKTYCFGSPFDLVDSLNKMFNN